MTIKELRRQKELSQTQLAQKLHLSQRAISFFENGQREPCLSTLVEMAITFNCSIDTVVNALIEAQKQNATKNKESKNEKKVLCSN